MSRVNITPKRSSDNLDEIQGVVRPSEHKWVVSTRHSAPSVTTTSAFDAYDQVLAQAGATLPMRDSVDQRIVNDVKNGTGRIIDDPSEVGGWPQLAAGTPPIDTDHDGMADNWEISQFGNLSRDGTGDSNSNGYTDLEEYLNQLAGVVPPPPSPPLPGDIDKDGDVDIFDYNLMIENFGKIGCGNVADINDDCKIDIFDYNILIENFGK